MTGIGRVKQEIGRTYSTKQKTFRMISFLGIGFTKSIKAHMNILEYGELNPLSVLIAWKGLINDWYISSTWIEV